MLNDIVQSVLDEVSNYRHGAFRCVGIAAIWKPVELNELRRQCCNDVALSPLARIPDRFS